MMSSFAFKFLSAHSQNTEIFRSCQCAPAPDTPKTPSWTAYSLYTPTPLIFDVAEAALAPLQDSLSAESMEMATHEVPIPVENHEYAPLMWTVCHKNLTECSA